MLAVGGGAYALYSGDDDPDVEEPEPALYTYKLSKLSPLETQVLFGELSSVCDTLVVKTGETDVCYKSFYVSAGKMYGFKYNTRLDAVVDGDPYLLKGSKNQYSGDYVIQVQKGSTKKVVTELSFYSDKVPTVTSYYL